MLMFEDDSVKFAIIVRVLYGLKNACAFTLYSTSLHKDIMPAKQTMICGSILRLGQKTNLNIIYTLYVMCMTFYVSIIAQIIEQVK